MSGKCVPLMPATWIALPKNIWCRVKITFWAGNFHFVYILHALPLNPHVDLAEEWDGGHNPPATRTSCGRSTDTPYGRQRSLRKEQRAQFLFCSGLPQRHQPRFWHVTPALAPGASVASDSEAVSLSGLSCIFNHTVC